MKEKTILILGLTAIFMLILVIIFALIIMDNNNSQHYHYSAEKINPGTILIMNNEEYSPQGMISINITTSPSPVGGCIVQGFSNEMVIPDTHVCHVDPFITYDPSKKGATAWIFGEHNNSYADTTEVTMTGNYINGTSRVIQTFTV